MFFLIRYFYIFTCIFLFCSNPSFSQTISYSIAPYCKNKEVICKNPNEVPVCIVLNPKVHIENINLANKKRINRFQPSCTGYKDNYLPGCVDIDAKGYPLAKGVILECIENVKCKLDKNKNKIIAFCEEGKIPKCLGSENSPDCEKSALCEGKSIPLCDYEWKSQAYNN